MMIYQTEKGKVTLEIRKKDAHVVIKQNGKTIAEFRLEMVWDDLKSTLAGMLIRDRKHHVGLARRKYEAAIARNCGYVFADILESYK